MQNIKVSPLCDSRKIKSSKNPIDFDLKLAEATLFEEFKSLRHGLLGHKFDRLIYRK